MAISRIGAAVGTNSATLPSFQVGDVAFVFAFRDGNATNPSVPTGWKSISNTIDTTSGSATVGWRRLQTGDTTTGTWTNASRVSVVVYRGLEASFRPYGGFASSNGVSTTITYAALTMKRANSTSWVLGMAGHRSTNTSLETAPSGMTNIAAGSAADATAETAAHDTNAAVNSWSSTNVSAGGTSSGWCSATIELLADTDIAKTTPVSDNFTRADNADLGSNWDENTAEENTGGFNISSNNAVPVNLANDSAEAYNAYSPAADQWAEVTFNACTGNGIGTGSGIQLRGSANNAKTFYRLIGSSSGTELQRFNAGTGTVLLSSTATTWATGNKMSLELKTVGSEAWWCIKKNVSGTITIVDEGVDASPLTGAGRIGLANSSAPTSSSISLFEGGGFSTSQTITVNQATETGTSQAVAKRKTKAAAQIAETATAQAATSRSIYPVAQASNEANTATVVGKLKSKATAQAVTTETAQPVTRAANDIVVAVAQAVESNSSGATARRKIKAVAQVAESASAQTISIVGIVSEAAETSTAQPLKSLKRKNITQPVEASASLTFNNIGAYNQTFIDAFTRADNADLGADWDAHASEESTAGYRITSNRATPDVLNADTSESLNAWIPPVDQWAEVTYSASDSTGAVDSGGGVALRLATGARTYYRVVGGDSGIDLRRFVNGVGTGLFSTAGTLIDTAGDRLRVGVRTVGADAVITIHKISATGVLSLVTEFTDTSPITAAGRVGVAFSSTANSHSFSEFRAGDFTAGEQTFVAVQQATESNTAPHLANRITVGLPQSTETAQQLKPVRLKFPLQVVENGTALAMARLRVRAMLQSIENSIPMAALRLKRRAVATISEAAVSQAISQATPINISVTWNQTSGPSPLRVVGDATLTSAIASTTNPFEDLLYIWFWDDALGDVLGNVFWTRGTRTSGNSRNVSFGAVGAHTYDIAAGGGDKVKSPRLVVYDIVSNTFKQQTFTNAITVNDPDTFYSGTNTVAVGASTLPVAGQNGVPAGAQCFQQSNWQTLVSTYLATNKRVMLIPGQTYTRTGNVNIGTITNGMITYVNTAGAKPRIIATGTGTYFTLGGTNNGMRFVGLDFDGQDNASLGLCTGNGSGTVLSKTTFLRCEVHNMGGGVDFHPDNVLGAMPTGVAFVDGRLERFNSNSSIHPIGIRLSGIYCGIEGSLIRDTLHNNAEQLARFQVIQKTLFTDCSLDTAQDGSTGPGNKELVSVRGWNSSLSLWGQSGEANATKYNRFAHNKFVINTYAGIDFTQDGENPPLLCHHNIVEGNEFKNDAAGGGAAVRGRGDRCTVRCNTWFGENGENFVATMPALGSTPQATNWRILSNTCYTPNSFATAQVFIATAGGTGHITNDNIGWHPGRLSETWDDTDTGTGNSTDGAGNQTRNATANYPGFANGTPTESAHMALQVGSPYVDVAALRGDGLRVAFDFNFNVRDKFNLDTGGFNRATIAVPGSLITLPLNQASETSTGQKLVKRILARQAIEANSANTISENATILNPNQVTEANTAQPVAKRKTKAVGQAVVTNTAQVIVEQAAVMYRQSSRDPSDLTFWESPYTRIVQPGDSENPTHNVPIGISEANRGAQDHNDPFCMHVVDSPAAHSIGATGRGYHLRDAWDAAKANNTDAGTLNNGTHRNQPIAYITDYCWAAGVGQTVYIGAWMYWETVPVGLNWASFFQINANGGGAGYWYGCPGLHHNWFSPRKILYNVATGPDGPVFDATPNLADPQIPEGQWVHFEVAYRPGTAENGYFEARMNGVPFLQINNFTNSPSVNATIELYWMTYAASGLPNGTVVERWQSGLTVANAWQYAPLGFSGTAGTATVANTAQPVAKRKVKAVNLATATDTAGVTVERKVRAVPVSTETATAGTAVAKRLKVTLAASTIETAQPAAVRNIRLVHAATESNSSNQIIGTEVRVVAVNFATYSATAQPVTRVKRIPTAPATTTESATPFSPSDQRIIAVAPATYNATAQPAQRIKRVTLAQALDSGFAETVTERKLRSIGLPSESASATICFKIKQRTVPVAVSTETAQLVNRMGIMRVIAGTAINAEFSQVVSLRKVAHIIQVQDIHFGLGAIVTRRNAIGLATEANSPMAITVAGGVQPLDPVDWLEYDVEPEPRTYVVDHELRSLVIG